MDKETVDMIITVVLSLLASSGFWVFLNNRIERKSLTTKLLLGLAQDRIMYLGLNYIKRGFITKDEYENIHDNIWCPYSKMGGNGLGKHIMDEVDKLPIKNVNLTILAEQDKLYGC